MQKITIIDTFGYLFRLYHAVPKLTSRNGFPTGLLTGFVNFIAKVKRENESDFLVFAADSGRSFRADLYAEYKANRKEPDDDLKKQIPIALDWISKMGFFLLKKDNYEADDLIASLAVNSADRGIYARIVSSDKDMYQLIQDDRIVIYDPVKYMEIDSKGCFNKFGVEPKNFIDFQAILGDTSDNVPGVKGIGEKGAANLINNYRTLEKIYDNLEEIGGRTKELLIANRDNAFISKELVTLKKDAINFDINYNEFLLPENPIANIAEDLAKLEIKAIFKREKIAPKPVEKKVSSSLFGEDEVKENLTFERVLITNDQELLKIVDEIPKNSLVSFDTETDNLNVREAAIVGFSFAYEETKGFYAAIGHRYLGAPEQISIKAAKTAIEKLFENNKIIAQNAKFDMHILEYALDLKNMRIFADTIIMAWLINSEIGQRSEKGLDTLAKIYLNHEMISFKETTKGLKNFSEVELSAACDYAAEDAVITFKLYPILLAKLDETLLKVYNEIELPFLYTLMAMEDKGLTIDTKFFENLRVKIHEEEKELENKIKNLAGRDFDINSPLQLAIVLAEDLKIPLKKRTSTGAFSTDESVLSELEHPIAEAILAYREIYKLQSTYINPFLTLEQGGGKVYTTLSQVGTTTGRLSSRNPNLQNIPARTETGRQIRRGFVAPKGHKLLSADYSQIELRLLAHFSGDPTMIAAFKSGADIHAEMARTLFGEGREREMRAAAKSVNFGVIYGMGARKLSADIGISNAEAKEVIDGYFAKFPTIRDYLEAIKREAREIGFVSTLLGRRRLFDFAGLSNGGKIAAAEREAVNTRFQGSAADLIKLAMLALDRRFSREAAIASKVQMTLQIHDELLFVAREDFASEAAAIIKEAMTNVYSLNVPLEVSVAIADNWADLK
ncbi:MAG: DNA polymerase I [Helicobacteraceae bacterium]|jgi:DNA polymerase-1|nr:DNA polymerase I [Helicobacteraceae bacterium]